MIDQNGYDTEMVLGLVEPETLRSGDSLATIEQLFTISYLTEVLFHFV